MVDDSSSKSGEFADRLAAIDESIRAQRFDRQALESGEMGSPSTAAVDISAAIACLERLEQLWPRADASPESRTESTLGDFRLIREIGRGGMGVVYEARQISLSRRVALKVLPFASVLDDRQIQRFKNESLAAAQLDHPHIVQVHGTGCERGVHYYAMQFIDGHSLAESIVEMRQSGQRNEPKPSATPQITNDRDRNDHPDTSPMALLSTECAPNNRAYFRRITQVAIQIADALEYAHAAGVVHRDIKPSNLLLDHTGKVYVADFGLAQVETEAGLTMSGDVLGTLRYMSPEQALGRKGTIDYRSDIYSLGVTLYELLTLRPAFPETDRAQLLRQVAHEAPQGPRQANPQIPVDLETVVLKSIEKEPALRYAAAGELAADLRRFQNNEPIKARRPTLRQRLLKWAARHRGFVIATLLMLFIATGFAGVSGAMILTERQRRETAEQQQFYEQQIREQQDAVIAEKEETARTHRYVANINLAWQAWNRSKVDEMREILERCIPNEGDTDLRSFEWHYLWKLCHSPPKPIGRHEGPAYYIAFAPDEKTFATGGSDGVRLWDAATGQHLRHLNAHKGDVNSMCFSPDGKLMSTASDDRTVHLWDTRTWEIHRTFKTRQLAIAGQFSPDGKLFTVVEKIKTISRDNRATVYATDDWRKLKVFDFDGHYNEIRGVCFSRDSTRMATFSQNAYCTMWDVKKITYVAYLGGIFAFRCGDFDPDGNYVALGCDDGKVRFGGTARSNYQPFPPLVAHSTAVETVVFSKDGRLLVTSGRDGIARLWKRKSDGSIAPVPDRVVKHFEPLWNARISNDNHTLLTVDQKGNVFRHDLRQRFDYEPPQVQARFRGEFNSSAMMGDGSKIAMLIDDYVIIRSASTGQILDTMRNVVAEQNSLAVSPDGSLLAVGSKSGEIVLFDLATKKRIRRWSLKPVAASAKPQIEALHFSPDGRLLTPSGVYFRPVFLNVNSDTGESVYTVPENLKRTVRWFPDGSRLVMNSKSGFVVWKPVNGTITPLSGVGGWLSDVDWSKDGNLMAAIYSNGLIRLLDGKTLKERTTWIADLRGAASVACAPDGKTVATTGAYGGIRLWNVATGRELFSLPLETSVKGRSTVRFAADSRTLAAFAPNGPERQLSAELRLWSTHGARTPPIVSRAAR